MASPRIYPTYTPIPVPDVKIAIPVYGTSPVFDFNKGEFMTHPNGQIVMATGTEALKQWITKALATTKFKHPIYPFWYGTDMPRQIGNNKLNNSAIAIIASIEAQIKATLIADPRITDVLQFTSQLANDALTTTFTVITTLGQQLNLSVVTEL